MKPSLFAKACLAASLALAAATASARAQESEYGPADATETYYWVSNMSNLPLFVAYDYKGLKAAADELGVKVRVAGPTAFDLAAFIATVDQVCAQSPAGVSVVGWDPSLTEPVNNCLANGVPTVTDDADLPDSDRLSFIGTDWGAIGVAQAKAMIENLPDGGKVALLSIINADNMIAARKGFKAYLDAKAPGKFEVVAEEDDAADSAQAAAKTAALLAAYPDLAGIAGFDAESGAGIVSALREGGKQPGDIVVTAMEQSVDFYNTVKEGYVQAIIVQNRELFTYYAIKMLYDYNHNGLKTVGLSAADGGRPIPPRVDTGLLVVNQENVDKIVAALSK
ncbi:MAG: substrate-binding domain-containing protein [Bauldia sp.]|nr:substrate-binding domain-containing protein [Bauldia sp.]